MALTLLPIRRGSPAKGAGDGNQAYLATCDPALSPACIIAFSVQLDRLFPAAF
jgi:hypothetical protein